MSLEPIEEKDLDLKGKFISGEENKNNIEIPTTAEKAVERKEGFVEGEDAYTKILSKVQTTTIATNIDEVKKDADVASQKQGMEAKVSNLVNVAMQKGVAHAVKVAKHMNDNYMMDEFHDRMMMDELHNALLEKGLIKEL